MPKYTFLVVYLRSVLYLHDSVWCDTHVLANTFSLKVSLKATKLGSTPSKTKKKFFNVALNQIIFQLQIHKSTLIIAHTYISLRITSIQYGVGPSGYAITQF